MIMPVMSIIMYSLLVMVKKAVLCSAQFSLPVEKSNSTRTFNPRPSSYSIDVKRNDLTCLGIQIYNSLPTELKEIEVYSLFKKKIKGYLLKKNSTLCSEQQISNRYKLF